MLLVCRKVLSLGGIWHPALGVAFAKLGALGGKNCRACESLACVDLCLGDAGVE